MWYEQLADQRTSSSDGTQTISHYTTTTSSSSTLELVQEVTNEFASSSTLVLLATQVSLPWGVLHLSFIVSQQT